ncbi:Photosystem I P700 chlorophyll a apoprotein A2 [Microbacterium lemovicicum]|uniref:Photosystem I P700 chlorophyll a apoprotein A2 n=1 Tax=Microbacterium lemovicicum TaxID=1072463 RepID=A0A3S9W749_9MICO|nr:OmpA family protein [Microbacterium lemovicicum]AZS35922.1 Photosystem I P700 chlorophyll a apoprotein A2 [Microbacterium lemovicicum]
MNRTRPLHLSVTLVVAGTIVLLSGCSAQVVAAGSAAPPASATPSASATGATAAAVDAPTVAGYPVGEFPPVPLFQLPDLALLDGSASAFTIDLTARVGDHPGLTVAPAHCDASGAVVSGAGSAYLYGDGSGTYTGPDGTVQNFRDGSGTTVIGDVTIQNFGDGSGTYADGATTIQNFGDGSGTYVDPELAVQIFGDGSGNWTRGDVTIQNFGDGSGTYADGTTRIQNFGDGSGTYTDPGITIQNFGDGTGVVDGTPVEVAPIATVPVLGVFPTLATLAPLASCGTTITLSDGVLFDFDQAVVRSDAVPVLDALARALGETGAPQAVISGHTDAIGSDDDNQELSERRAAAVVAALRDRGVSGGLSAEGFGESRPVAPDEIDGADNPAGRQLNRRVEIFIPAFGA